MTIKTHKKTLSGIKENSSLDIDFVWRHYKALAIERLGVDNVVGFECVMISTLSNALRDFRKKQNPQKPRRYGNY